MARRYTLNQKIAALDDIDDADGDVLIVSRQIDIPISTLQTWRAQEADIRREHRGRINRQFARLKTDLQVKLLDKGLAIIDHIDEDLLDNAPLNQLASALGTLVNHALKLEEAIEDTDEQTEEKVVRFEFLYDGSVHKTPPWADESPETSSPIQASSLRETVGKNGTGENRTNGRSRISGDTWLVDDTDLPDVESSLAGFEDDCQERDWYHD